MDNTFDVSTLDAAFYLELTAAVDEAFKEGKDARELDEACAPTLRSGELPKPVEPAS